MTKKLSDKNYWDKVLKDTQLLRCNTDKIYGYKITIG